MDDRRTEEENAEEKTLYGRSNHKHVLSNGARDLVVLCVVGGGFMSHPNRNGDNDDECCAT